MIQMPPLGGIFLCNRGVMTLAATRLIALHKNKGKSVAACLKSRTDYAQNPDKTNKGELVSSYECSPLTADEEFMLSKRQYELMTGRRQKNDVIAYQIRQSFKPGEITAEEANKVGYELAMRFTKGKYAGIEKSAEECGAVLRRGKRPQGKIADPLSRKHRGFFPFGGESSVFFFVIGAFGTNAQPASGGCSTQRVWDYPNKHFATQKWRLYIRTPCLRRRYSRQLLRQKF